MRGHWFVLLVAAACGSSGKSSEIPRSNKPLTAQEIVKRSSLAIVRVEAQGADGEQFGTGFIVDKSGIVATNFHVIQGTSDIKIKLNDGTHHQALHVVSVDPVHDLVLLKFRAEKPMPALVLGDSSKVSTGEKIVAIGNPLGVFENTVSEGLISSIRQLCPTIGADCPAEYTLLQISAPISQGSSGGPLFNQVGEVVGVTTAIIAQGQLINFAMPVNYLKPMLAKQETIALDEFAKATKREGTAPGGGGGKVDRAPYAKDGFAVAVYDGCKADQIAEVVKSIEDAIEIGAPLYNRGDIEACFRIYEGVARKVEQSRTCKGVRGAFNDVLLKVEPMTDFKGKAWAMRDTFDGLLIAAKKWAANKPK